MGNFRAFPSQTLKSSSFLVKFHSNRLNYNRFGVTISAKVEPKSTRRHFFKRLFFDAIKNWPPLGKDFLIIVQANISYVPPETVKSEIHLIGQKIQSL